MARDGERIGFLMSFTPETYRLEWLFSMRAIIATAFARLTFALERKKKTSTMLLSENAIGLPVQNGASMATLTPRRTPTQTEKDGDNAAFA